MQQERKDKELPMAEIITPNFHRKGVDHGPIDDNDWLSKLKVGTIFVCEIIQDQGLPTVIQQEYSIQRKDGRSVLLMANLNEPAVYARVNPSRFSKYHRWIVTIYEPEKEQENADY